MRDTEEQFESRLLRWGGATAPVSVPAAWDGEGVWMCGMGRRQHMCTRVSSALCAA